MNDELVANLLRLSLPSTRLDHRNKSVYMLTVCTLMTRYGGNLTPYPCMLVSWWWSTSWYPDKLIPSVLMTWYPERCIRSTFWYTDILIQYILNPVWYPDIHTDGVIAESLIYCTDAVRYLLIIWILIQSILTLWYPDNHTSLHPDILHSTSWHPGLIVNYILTTWSYATRYSRFINTRPLWYFHDPAFVLCSLKG
jgi:hypothetical protein